MDSEGELEKAWDRTVCEAVVEIKNTDGLCMLAATRFVKTSGAFGSSINVRSGEKVADGKSVMQMCTLAASSGSKLRITAEGVDAQEAIAALWELVEERSFGESAPDCQKLP